MGTAIGLALAAALLFGAATPLSKALLGTIDPFVLAGLLYLGAGLALAPTVLRSAFFRKLRALDARNGLYVVASVIGGGMAGPVLLLFGLRLAKSASVSLWLNLELVATMALGHLFFKDRMTLRSAMTALGILGASIVLSLDGGATSIAGGLLVAAACVAWGLDNSVTALIDGLDPKESTFIKGAVAGSTNLVIGLLAGSLHRPDVAPILGALALGALSYGLSIVLYISAAHGLGASRAQFFFSSSPLFGLVLAALVLGESISLFQFAAIGLMVVSYLILLTERHEHDHSHETLSHMHWHRHDEGHHLHGHDGLGLVARLFGHSHGHLHEATTHAHPHVPDIHHRHGHEAPPRSEEPPPSA